MHLLDKLFGLDVGHTVHTRDTITINPKLVNMAQLLVYATH